MVRFRLLIAGVVLGVCCGSASAQPFTPCGDAHVQTTAEAQRRREGLTAVRVINVALDNAIGILQRRQGDVQFPTWDELADLPAVKTLRIPGGKDMRDVATMIRWGNDEPLPGWRIHFVAGRDSGYMFTLRDVRDRCEFGYVADDSGLIAETHTVQGGRGQVVPLGTR